MKTYAIHIPLEDTGKRPEGGKPYSILEPDGWNTVWVMKSVSNRKVRVCFVDFLKYEADGVTVDIRLFETIDKSRLHLLIDGIPAEQLTDLPAIHAADPKRDRFEVDWFTLVAAFRYYLGRMTIAAASFAQDLRKYRDQFSPEQRRFFIREITEHRDRWGKVGMDCDDEQWMLTAAYLGEQRVLVTVRLNDGSTGEAFCVEYAGRYYREDNTMSAWLAPESVIATEPTTALAK